MRTSAPILADTLEPICAAFERALAEHASAVHQWRLRFADRPVRLRIVGPELAANLAGTFSHLIEAQDTPAETVDLTMDLWDAAWTGVACPELPINPTRTWNVGGHPMRFTDDHRALGYQEPRSTVCLDRAVNRILGCFPDGGHLCLHERSKPFPELLSVWYQDRDIQQLHAGMVGQGGRGVLFVGASGSGKSTSTLASVIGGLDYLGDDFVGLELKPDGSCIGHSLYAGARAAVDHLHRLPELAAHAIAPSLPEDDKSLVFMARAFPERMARRVRLAAVVLPKVVGSGATTFAPVPKAQSLLRIMPTVMVSAPGSGRSGFHNLAGLVERVPSFAMQIGSSVGDIPTCVGQILDQVSHP